MNGIPHYPIQYTLQRSAFSEYKRFHLIHIKFVGTWRFVETMHFTITDQNAPAECCSSVVFLPGIKGSVLKKDRLLTEDTLWPPTIWSDDVSELALDEEGNSIEDVFVDGLLNTFKGVSVYGGFSSYMDELVGEGLISEWQSLPYFCSFL